MNAGDTHSESECKIVLNGRKYSLCYFMHVPISGAGTGAFPLGERDTSEGTALDKKCATLLRLSLSAHKSSPFVPKRTKRDTSCNHKNSTY